MVRFAILTLTCASRRNRLQFSSLICLDGSAPAALAGLLFDGPGPQTIRKAQCFATFYLFTHFDLLSFDTFSSLIFFFFSSLTLPTSAASSSHFVRSLTSKFPSTTTLLYNCNCNCSYNYSTLHSTRLQLHYTTQRHTTTTTKTTLRHCIRLRCITTTATTTTTTTTTTRDR